MQEQNFMATFAPHSNRNDLAMAVLRIAVGLLFLIFGEYKVFGTGFTLHGGFQFWIQKCLADGAYPFMLPFLRTFVLPHLTPIAFLVAYAALSIRFPPLLAVPLPPPTPF